MPELPVMTAILVLPAKLSNVMVLAAEELPCPEIIISAKAVPAYLSPILPELALVRVQLMGTAAPAPP
jgi:hypothetical protein